MTVLQPASESPAAASCAYSRLSAAGDTLIFACLRTPAAVRADLSGRDLRAAPERPADPAVRGALPEIRLGTSAGAPGPGPVSDPDC